MTITCKHHYINCLIEQLGTSDILHNATYKSSMLTREDICLNHTPVLSADTPIPLLHWIPKHHKDPYKESYIAVPPNHCLEDEQ